MRVVLKLLLGLFLVGLLALATLPWWCALVLRPIAQAQGLTFARYERVGYARFRLHDVRRDDPVLRLRAAVVEADTPLLWAWRVLRQADSVVLLNGWSVESTGAAPTSPHGSTPGGMAELHAVVEGVFTRLARWVPSAELHQGTLRFAAVPPVAVETVRWDHGVLAADRIEISGRRFDLDLQRDTRAALVLRVRAPAEAAQVELTWAGAGLDGTARWQGQPLRLRARFPERGWVPADAQFVAENWHIPAASLHLPPEYAEVVGGARLDWRDARFELTAEGRALPQAGAQAPPLHARLAAHGDRSAITVTAVDVEAPFASAKLNAPLTISFAAPHHAPPAQLQVQADLSRQPWFEGGGRVEGLLAVHPTMAGATADFRFACADLRLAEVAVQRAIVEGELAWPELTLRRAEIALDAQSRLTAQGVINIATRGLTHTVVEGTLTPAWLRRWLPAGLEWATADFRATLSGPFAAAEHQGRMTLARAQVAPLRPADLVLEWRGRGAAATEVSVTATAGESALQVRGTFSSAEAQLDELRWRRRGGDVLTLVAPARLAWREGWRIEDLRLQGARTRVSLAGHGGPATLAFSAAVEGVESAWLRDWVDLPGPDWIVSQFRADGSTRDQALEFTADAAGEVLLGSGPLAAHLVAGGDATGVALTRGEVRDAAGPIAHATARLPLRCVIAGAPRWRIEHGQEWQIEFATDSGAALWSALAAARGLSLESPRVRLRIAGTPAAPIGELEAFAARIGVAEQSGSRPLPAVEELALRAHATRAELVLDTLTARIENQPWRARGRLPLAPDAWLRLLRHPADFDWGEAEAELELPETDVRVLAARWDRFPLTQGRVALAVRLARGLALSGSLRLMEGTSRPIPSVGVLQEVTADLELQGRTVAVRTLSAQLGGETATVTGAADLSTPSTPRLDLRLAGRNLPLVRRAGLLLRSDLDLAVTTDAAGATRIGGTVNLRDSLVLADLRQWLPTGVRAAGRAPPYFAVAAAPFHDWRLEVAVGGPRGLRLHTPVLTGWASPRIQLEGTLGEPRAVGEVVLEEGRILFPFAAFRVQQGTVRLSRADPFHPQLRLDAAVRRYGYDLRLEGRGPVDQPILTFAAAPALTSEQVLLLVMAGQMPGDTASAITGDRKRLTALSAYLGRGFLGLGGDDAERLTISSGEQTTRQGAETYLVEYLLGERWSLIGEYDEFDDYNVGLRWRVYSQGGDDAAR